MSTNKFLLSKKKEKSRSLLKEKTRQQAYME